MNIARHRCALTTTIMTTTTTPSPWHAAYPVPKQASPAIDRQEVLELLRSEVDTAKKTYILVDLRRNDHEVRSIIIILCDQLNGLIDLGRYYSWIYQSSRTKLASNHTYLVRSLQRGRGREDHMVLL